MKIVKKVWGKEYLIVNRKEYCGKKLLLKRGYRCSLHFHKKKDETFYVIRGQVLMEIGKKKWIMKYGDVQHVAPWFIHRFTGLTDAEIIEFSTHHSDADNYRKTTSEKVGLRRAYDYDGVITTKIKPEEGAPIITGRSFEELNRVEYEKVKGHPVYFNPVTWGKNTLQRQIKWKAEMIRKLGIEEFYEDNCIVIEGLKKKCLNCQIIKI